MRFSTGVSLFVLAAAMGLAVFGYFARNATTVESLVPTEAEIRFAAIRAAFPGAEPLLVLEPGGKKHRHPRAAGTTPADIANLRILVYRAGEGDLVETRIPFWFVKLKGPALRLLMRGTGVYFKPLNITVADLERYGPGLVLDQARENGDHVLVWMDGS